MLRALVPLAVTLLVAALASAAPADEVVLRSGATYSGKLVAEDDTTVTIDTPDLGRMRLPKSDVDRVKRAEAPAAPAPDAAAGADAGAAKRRAAAPKAAARTAEERESRRKASKIVRRTEPQAETAARTAEAAPEREQTKIVGGILGKVERGSWLVLFQPPRPFAAAPLAIELGRRTFARLEMAGVSAVWLCVPEAAGERRAPVAMSDVQRHVVVRSDASRIRMIEGVDKGDWLRARLADGSTFEGQLDGIGESTVVVSRAGEDGAPATTEIDARTLIEVDGLMRQTGAHAALADAATGEPVALTFWPDGREIVGYLRERTDVHVVIETQGRGNVTVPRNSPLAEVRRVPPKWREAVRALPVGTAVHVRSAEDFPDARVERDLVGTLAALTAHAVVLAGDKGATVVPFDQVRWLAVCESETEAAAAKTRRASSYRCDLPIVPGAPCEKAAGLDPAQGVSAATDGRTVTHVFVTSPFDGEVYGVRLGQKIGETPNATDLRFDTVVTPRSAAEDFKPAEMTSTTIDGMRVTLLLDDEGAVTAVELVAR
jgi:hypothetical protein